MHELPVRCFVSLGGADEREQLAHRRVSASIAKCKHVKQMCAKIITYISGNCTNWVRVYVDPLLLHTAVPVAVTSRPVSCSCTN